MAPEPLGRIGVTPQSRAHGTGASPDVATKASSYVRNMQATNSSELKVQRPSRLRRALVAIALAGLTLGVAHAAVASPATRAYCPAATTAVASGPPSSEQVLASE
jgi:hypothetical protein